MCRRIVGTISNLGPDYPVACVTSYEAEAFANWLGETAGVTIELPTEAQWGEGCAWGRWADLSLG
jgi:formylglycine-generating enzyme required for sulfatase activity